MPSASELSDRIAGGADHGGFNRLNISAQSIEALTARQKLAQHGATVALRNHHPGFTSHKMSPCPHRTRRVALLGIAQRSIRIAYVHNLRKRKWFNPLSASTK